MNAYTFTFLLAIFGLSMGSIDDHLNDLNFAGIANNITESLDFEKSEQLLRDKCLKNSNDEKAFDNARKASEEAQKCVSGLVDVEKLKEEIEEAKPTGDLDLVFKNYCHKSPILKKCIANLTLAYEPCLEKSEIDSKDTVLNVTDSLIDFICFKDGDRIALFIAEKGPECINESSDAIKTCFEKVFSHKLSDELPEIETLPLLLFDAQQCGKFTELQRCVVKALERCSESTPSNVVESLFNFARKHTPCANHKSAVESKNSAYSLSGSHLSVLLSFFTIAHYFRRH